jgi:replicative DNA helicase
MALVPALDLRTHGDPRDRIAHPPSNVEAEQALIGALLYQPEVLTAFQTPLKPEHFYEPFHGRLWKAMREWIDEGEIPDPTLLAEEFRRDTAYIELGGTRYLADLIDRAPPVARAEDYARAILDLFNRRKLMELAAEMTALAMRGEDADGDRIDANQVIAKTEEGLMAIKLNTPDPPTLLTARESAIRTMEEIDFEQREGKPRGAQTSLKVFDDKLGGLVPSWLITIGGRPSMGKSALMRSAMYGAAVENRHDLFAIFLIEMASREISERAISAVTREDIFCLTETQALNRSKPVREHVPELMRIAEQMPDNLYIDDRADLSLEDVTRVVWQLKAKGNLRAIAIDYLQLMRRPEHRGRSDAAILGDMTAALKRLAKAADICIVLLSQLSRDVDKRDDKRPVLGDLRESGAIEQDSNVVLFPFREAYYHERAKPEDGTAEAEKWSARLAEIETVMEVAVAKHRQGGIGTTKQQYFAAYDLIKN